MSRGMATCAIHNVYMMCRFKNTYFCPKCIDCKSDKSNRRIHIHKRRVKSRIA
jgi:hypothetical protein